MGLFELFGKKGKEQRTKTDKTGGGAAGPGIYEGMRVEVTMEDDTFLFAARLINVQGDTAELHQESESGILRESGPAAVRIRGYSDSEKKAVYMEGVIAPGPGERWKVSELTVSGCRNDRAYFRLATDLPAVVVTSGRASSGEEPCSVQNISLGGACIASEHRYERDELILLRVRLSAEDPVSAIFCQVLRVTEKEAGGYEYGCRFREVTQEDQNRITQKILTVQRKNRESGGV